MSKKSKSKRFFQQSQDAMRRYDEQFPFHETLSENEKRKPDQKEGV